MLGTFAGVVAAVVFGSALLILLLTPIFCFIDVVRTPSTTFRAVGSSKILWIVLLIWFTIFAGIVYLAAVRPKLLDFKGIP